MRIGSALTKSQVFTRCWLFLLILALSPLFHPSSVFGQADQGTITGVITDSADALIPKAEVTLISVDTGLILKATTNEDGVYVFSPVKIGTYKIVAKASGFGSSEQSDLHLNIQQRMNVSLKLPPQSVSETVSVSSTGPLLQTEEASVGQVITAKVIDETPISGRNWVYVAQLSAGVAPSNGSKGQQKGDFSANGQREAQNNFILDGVDNNTNFPDFLNGSSYIVRPPADALAQYKVQTTDYTAEFGHSAGAVVNASLKTGTNSLHGALWEYFRNDKLNTRTAIPYTPVIPPYHQNQFGGMLGGPIFRNKLFFFVDTEANRIVQGTPTTTTVPTSKMRTGDFSELLSGSLTGTGNRIFLYQPGSAGGPSPATYAKNPASNPYVLSCNGQVNIFCASQMSQAALNILNAFPLPNNNSPTIQNNYTGVLKTRDDVAQWDARLDWNINEKDQAFVRYSYLNERMFTPSILGPVLNGGGGPTGNLGENFALSETHIFSPLLVNEFRFGYNYGHLARYPHRNGANVADSFGLGGIPTFTPDTSLGGLPTMSVSSLPGFGTPAYYPGFEYENVWQVLDNVTRVMGNHALKFGFNFQRIRVSETKPTSPFGSYSYTGVYTSAPSLTSGNGITTTGWGAADFLANYMASATITPTFNTDNVQWYRTAYVQDDWKATPKLTINAGVRYEFPQPYWERNDNQANYYPTGPLSAGSGTANFVLPKSKQGIALPPVFLNYIALDHLTLEYSDNRSLVNAQKLNFTPRIGFAYSPTDKLVLRGGYGIFLGGLEGIGPGVNLGQNVPFNFTSNFPNTGCKYGACVSNGIRLETGFASQISSGLLNAVTTPLLTGAELNQKIPYSQQFNLAVQYLVDKNTTATLAYVGGVTRHLQVEYDPNRPRTLMATGSNTNPARPFPHFSSTNYTMSAGSSGYNSLQASLERRYFNGITFLAAYTYAHSLDNAQADLAETSDVGYRAPGIIPLSAEYSNSGFDVRHRFAFNGNYELPFGVGRRHLNTPGVKDLLVGGWSSTLTFRAQTGFPFSITPSNFSSAAGLANAFAYPVRDIFSPGGSPDPTNPSITCAAKTRTVAHWYNPCAFANPLSGNKTGLTITDAATAIQYAGGKRLSIEGPGYERIDMSFFKRFHLEEKQYLQLRADIFNVLNTPSYNIPGQNNDGSSGGQILSVRQPMAFTPDSRFYQFSAKYVF